MHYRLQLWEAYRLENPQGCGRSRFNQHLQNYIGRTHPIIHVEHKQGDKCFIDIAGEKLTITDQDTGELLEIEAFVAILGCS